MKCFIQTVYYIKDTYLIHKYIHKYFGKVLLKNFENSVIGTSSPVTLKKKFLSA